MRSVFKILVTSQKGGVGKSTLSANLTAYFKETGLTTTLLDFDLHGSSSSWLIRAPPVGVVIQHHPLPLSMGGNRPLLDARLHLRRAAASSEVVVADLTWSDSIAGELMFDFDVVIVPTSVSEIELATTSTFLSKYSWVFDSKIHMPPTLLLAPTRVRPENLDGGVFSKQRFPVSFMLSPPVFESESARDMFEVGYLKDLPDACGVSFREFSKAVHSVRELRYVAKAQILNSRPTYSRLPTGRFVTNGSLSERQSVLSRHLIQQTAPVGSEPSHPCEPQTKNHVAASTHNGVLQRKSARLKQTKPTFFQLMVRKLANL